MIKVTKADWVATIEAADYAPLSRYDAAFAWELRDTIVALSDEDDVKAIVVRSAGPDFAPVVDGPLPDPRSSTWRRVFAGAKGIHQSLTFSKKVIITAVDGACAGAGSLLVLGSDLTVASPRSRFGSPFLAHPESNFVQAALTMRLNRAKAWAIGGSELTADEAADAGLVNDVVPAESLHATAQQLALEASAIPLDGVTMSKMLLQAVLDGHAIGREFDMAVHYAAHRIDAEQRGVRP